MREVSEGRGSPHGGVFLDISWIKQQAAQRARSTSRRSCRACTTSSSSWPTSTSPRADGGRPDDALHHGRHPGGRRHADVHRARAVRRRRVRRRPARREPAGRQLAVRPARVRQARRRVRGEVRAGDTAPRRSTPAQVDDAARRALEPFERGTASGEGPYQVQHELQDDDAGPGRHRADARPRCSARSRGSARCRSGRAQVGVAGNREYNPGWHTALDLRQPAHRLRGDHPRRARAEGEPRRPFPRRLSRTRIRRSAKFNIVVRKGPDGEMQLAREPIPEMPGGARSRSSRR